MAQKTNLRTGGGKEGQAKRVSGAEGFKRGKAHVNVLRSLRD